MKLIGVLLAILLSPFFLLTLLDSLGILKTDPAWRGKVGLACMLAFTGSAHFWATAPMARMLPGSLSVRVTLIYATGVLELLAIVGLFIPFTARFTAGCLIAFLVAVFPANIYAAVRRIDLAGQGAGPVYLLIRAPVQLFLIGWTWWFGLR